jgi:argininosuccinate synthase
MEGATRVAHGASGDDGRAMDLLLSELAPDLSVVGVAADSGGLSEPAVAANLWGRTVTVPSGVDPETLPASLLYQRTSQPAACQALPATVDLTFERSLPVAVNGIAMPFAEIVEVVETIAGDHGVGRSNTPLASGAREITEAPAAVTLGLALAELERTTLAPRLAGLKASFSWAYAAAIDDGAWFSTSRTALDAFVTAASAGVSGVVRIQLFRGECRVAESDATAAVGSRLSSVEAGL